MEIKLKTVRSTPSVFAPDESDCLFHFASIGKDKMWQIGLMSPEGDSIQDNWTSKDSNSLEPDKDIVLPSMSFRFVSEENLVWWPDANVFTATGGIDWWWDDQNVLKKHWRENPGKKVKCIHSSMTNDDSATTTLITIWFILCQVIVFSLPFILTRNYDPILQYPFHHLFIIVSICLEDD